MRCLCCLALALSPLLQAAPSDWSKTDTAVEAVVIAAMICDWRQTREFARTPQPPNKELYERNPFLGDNPSPGAINRFFIGGAALHVLLAVWMGPEWRHRWQGFQLGLSAVCIANNAKIGVRLKF